MRGAWAHQRGGLRAAWHMDMLRAHVAWRHFTGEETKSERGAVAMP